jgi:hypothetical protein
VPAITLCPGRCLNHTETGAIRERLAWLIGCRLLRGFFSVVSVPFSRSVRRRETPSTPSTAMANYLPVLLVSVAANSIPDDSSVSTLPRGQVDYLSHNWEEEDVWRSWRNMTRQKNEITNGVRLENASWRTWWKQRNGLGTVTPETLNW